MTDPSILSFPSAITGICSWTFATPLANGTASDHGLSVRDGSFGDPSGQIVFINNWGRMMSQTISPAIMNKDRVTTSIKFGTLGSDTDGGRGGRFFLVAGEADSSNPDVFSARSIILDAVSVANPTWSGFDGMSIKSTTPSKLASPSNTEEGVTANVASSQNVGPTEPPAVWNPIVSGSPRAVSPNWY